MNGESRRLQMTSKHAGVFNEYQMYGFQYEDDGGSRSWHVTAWHGMRNGVHSYWVTEDGEFLRVSMHIAYNYTNNTLIETFGPVTEIDPKEKDAILSGIAEWEKIDREATANG